MNRSKSDFSTVNCIAESEEIRLIYITKIILNTAMIREVNSTPVDYFILNICGEKNTRLRAITASSDSIKLLSLKQLKKKLESSIIASY